MEEDKRSDLANAICKLIWFKHEGVLKNCLTEARVFSEMCEDNIRNFYEVVENVPLFQYERYLRFGTKNWDMSQDEFEKAVHQASEDCYDRYDNKK